MYDIQGYLEIQFICIVSVFDFQHAYMSSSSLGIKFFLLSSRLVNTVALQYGVLLKRHSLARQQVALRSGGLIARINGELVTSFV